MKKINHFLCFALLSVSTSVSAEILPGLWLANVEVDKVNEVHSSSTNADTLTAVSYPFNLQLLLHCDAQGNTKLLKEVFVMQTKDDDTEDANVTRVLITDETKVSNYDGIIRKGDNKLVAVRLTTPSIDFDSGMQTWPLAGAISSDEGTTLTGSDIPHAKNHPTNPFRHQFHPEHKEGFDIDRSFVITTKKPDTGNKTNPTQGLSNLTGTYEETLVGLHKAPLKVSGIINMTRVSMIATLDPAE